MSSCFFIGHRDVPESLFPVLFQTLEQLVTEQGVTEFTVGNYGAFDRLAAHAVKMAKAKYPHITFTQLLPYHPAERPVDLFPGADGTFYPPGMESVPRRFAIVRANRYMVEHSDFLIAYAWHPGSNARNLVEYAQKHEITVINLVTQHSIQCP